MRKLFLLPLLLLGLAACKKETPQDLTADLNLNVGISSVTFNKPFDFSKVVVRITNLANNSTTTYSPINGVIHIPALSRGQYDINASVTIAKDNYNALTGENSNTDVSFNASFKNYTILGTTTLDLNLVAGVLGDFVIKQVYYAGSDQTNGALFRDQFFEIHNNTNEVLYADSLYVGRLWGKQNANDDKLFNYQSNKQFDWSKSIGQTKGDASNTDYVYLRDLIMIPGTGKTYPVQPGKSIIIAQNAMNHKVPYTNNAGKQVPVPNPDLTVDLSKANFEVYYGDLPGRTPYASDIDNPNVPNVDVIDFEGNDWILDTKGRDSYVIFKHSSRADVIALGSYYAPKIGAPTATEKKYRQLPTAWIIDAIDTQPVGQSTQIPKKLSPMFDAGSTSITGGDYSSQAVIRKVESKVNGVVKLKDTNNSTLDFVVIKANPFGFAE